MGGLILLSAVMLGFYEKTPFPDRVAGQTPPQLVVEKFWGYDFGRQGGGFRIQGERVEHFDDHERLIATTLQRHSGGMSEMVIAQEGLDHNGSLLLRGGVRYARSDGLALATKEMVADRTTGVMKTLTPFHLIKEPSLDVVGQMMSVDSTTKRVHAQGIKAVIFVQN